LPPYCSSASKKSLKENDIRKAGQRSVPRFAYDGLDRVIHERARLSLMTALATHSHGLTFNELKNLCALTDGNLNRHLQVLEEAKMVVTTKVADRHRRQTCCRITALGRKKYVDYLAVLTQVLTDAKAREAGDASAKGAQGAITG
jgi:DNA-binding MarR family transcriptional regulator